MRTAIVVLAVVGLCGCALTPAELIEQGERTQYSSRLAPAAAAECMARNAEEINPGFTTRIRPGTPPAALDVVAQIAGMGTTLLAQITPVAGGSSVNVWMSPQLMFHERAWGGQMVRGCEG